MSYFLALLFAVFGCLLVFVFQIYCTMKAKAARQYQASTRDFYDAVKPLLDDDETPDEILEILSFFNKTIDNPHVAPALAYYPMRRSFHSGGNEFTKIAVEFLNKRPELESSFTKSVGSWFIAVTALSPFSGAIARYSISNERVRDVASHVNKKDLYKDESIGKNIVHV